MQVKIPLRDGVKLKRHPLQAHSLMPAEAARQAPGHLHALPVPLRQLSTPPARTSPVAGMSMPSSTSAAAATRTALFSPFTPTMPTMVTTSSNGSPNSPGQTVRSPCSAVRTPAAIQWETASTHPPHLTTIVPVASVRSGVDFPIYQNGIFGHLRPPVAYLYQRPRPSMKRSSQTKSPLGKAPPNASSSPRPPSTSSTASPATPAPSSRPGSNTRKWTPSGRTMALTPRSGHRHQAPHPRPYRLA